MGPTSQMTDSLAAIQQDIHDLQSLDFVSAYYDVSDDEFKLPPQQREGLRREWNEKMEALKQRIRDIERKIPPETTITELLNSPILPPSFEAYKKSFRREVEEKDASRYYPPKIYDWTEFFSNVVDEYTPEDYGVEDRIDDRWHTLVTGVHVSLPIRNEDDEIMFVDRFVWQRLLGHRAYKPGWSYHDDQIVLDFDALTDDPKGTNNKVVSATMQTKTTHRLLLPNEFAELNEQYMKGLKRRHSNCFHWSKVCNPIAEAVGYMIDRDCRYAALCSASKTYFIHIDNGYRCKITNAWFTCDRTYMKAWAAFFHLASRNYDGSEIPKPPRRWDSNKPRDTPRSLRQKRTHEGLEKQDDESSSELSYSQVPPPFEFDFELDFVEYVEFDEIENTWGLGYGRSGGVRRTTWNGTQVAVKKFDLYKCFESYKKEIEAYKMLRDAWGKHVPQPLFISRSRAGVCGYLGMTLGKKMSDEDRKQNGNKYWKQFLDKVSILENEFGFYHMDVWEDLSSPNYIVDENDNVLVIDLEEWEHTKRTE